MERARRRLLGADLPADGSRLKEFRSGGSLVPTIVSLGNEMKSYTRKHTCEDAMHLPFLLQVSLGQPLSCPHPPANSTSPAGPAAAPPATASQHSLSCANRLVVHGVVGPSDQVRGGSAARARSPSVSHQSSSSSPSRMSASLKSAPRSIGLARFVHCRFRTGSEPADEISRDPGVVRTWVGRQALGKAIDSLGDCGQAPERRHSLSPARTPTHPVCGPVSGPVSGPASGPVCVDGAGARRPCGPWVHGVARA